MVWPEEDLKPGQSQQEVIRHQFFDHMEAIARGNQNKPLSDLIPQDLKALLQSDEAFAAVFLATGWMEAAIQLHKTEVIPDQFPEWVAYGLAKARQNNRRSREVNDFILRPRETPALKLVLAEAYLANDESDTGQRILSDLSINNSAIGSRAAWILSLL